MERVILWVQSGEFGTWWLCYQFVIEVPKGYTQFTGECSKIDILYNFLPKKIAIYSYFRGINI